MRLLLGNEYCEVVRSELRRADLWLPLQMTLGEMRNAIRRGDDFPMKRAGSRHVSDAETVCAWLVERSQFLAVLYVKGHCEGRYDLPRPADQHERPPSLTSRMHLLRTDARAGIAGATR